MLQKHPVPAFLLLPMRMHKGVYAHVQRVGMQKFITAESGARCDKEMPVLRYEEEREDSQAVGGLIGVQPGQNYYLSTPKVKFLDACTENTRQRMQKT